MTHNAPIKWTRTTCGGCGMDMPNQAVRTISRGLIGLCECINELCSVYGRIVLFWPERVPILGELARPSLGLDPADGPSRDTMLGLNNIINE